MSALLWMTHLWTPELAAEFEHVRAIERAGGAEVWLLADARTPGLADLRTRYPRVHVFEEQALLAGAWPRLPDYDGIWAHCHYPLLDFHRAHPEHAHYWLVEFDVRYSGDWAALLAAFDAYPHDLITAHLRSFADEPGYRFWPTLQHPTRTIPREHWWRSFNVAYRVSSRALAFLDEQHRDGWRGYPEACIATLLFHGGFSLLDLGDDGPFTPRARRRTTYRLGATRNGRLSPFGTITYRPARRRAGWRRDTLYHPVKPRALREPLAERWRIVRAYARAAWRHGLTRSGAFP